MKSAIVLDANDIKKVLSEHFNIPESNVIKSQYSYTIILNDDTAKEVNKNGRC